MLTSLQRCSWRRCILRYSSVYPYPIFIVSFNVSFNGALCEGAFLDVRYCNSIYLIPSPSIASSISDGIIKGGSEASHPVHVTERRATAFIPFCAFKSDLAISNGNLKLPGTNFPFCSLFKPTLLEGQLCYKLQLNEWSGEGKENELMLLLDYNEDLSLYTAGTDTDNVKEERMFNSTKLNLKKFWGPTEQSSKGADQHDFPKDRFWWRQLLDDCCQEDDSNEQLPGDVVQGQELHGRRIR